MNCIRCGREIPENEMLCSKCKLPPVTVLPDETHIAATAKKQRSGEKELQRQKRAKGASTPKAVRRLALALAIAIALLIGCGVLFYCCYDDYREYAEQKNNLKVREASVALREQEANNRDARIDSLEQDKLTLQQEIEKLENELEKTKERLNAALGKRPAYDPRVTAKR